MKVLGIAAATLGLCAVWGGLWRARWLRHAAQLADTEIRRNAAKPRPGMTHMDETLREKSARRRREHDEAIADLKRELRDERPRLHRVS